MQEEGEGDLERKTRFQYFPPSFSYIRQHGCYR